MKEFKSSRSLDMSGGSGVGAWPRPLKSKVIVVFGSVLLDRLTT